MTASITLFPWATLEFCSITVLMPLGEFRKLHQQSQLVSVFLDYEVVRYHPLIYKDTPDHELIRAGTYT
jgi:hypothetical protein